MPCTIANSSAGASDELPDADAGAGAGCGEVDEPAEGEVEGEEVLCVCGDNRFFRARRLLPGIFGGG